MGASCSRRLFISRSQFEEEQLQLTQGRLATLKKTQEEEEVKVVELEEQKRVLQEEITSGQETIERLRGGLKALNETLDEKTKTVEQVKKTHARAAKVLDQALKEIGTMVCGFFFVSLFVLVAELIDCGFIFPVRMTRLRSWHSSGLQRIASAVLKT
jgi:DNA repair ATPase RecN